MGIGKANKMKRKKPQVCNTHLPHYHAAEVDAAIVALDTVHRGYSRMALCHRVFVRNTNAPVIDKEEGEESK